MPTPPRPSPTPVGKAAPVGDAEPDGRRAGNQARRRMARVPHLGDKRAPRPTPLAKATPVTEPNAATGPSPVRIDPRIKRRWIEVRRDEGRRRFKILVASLAVIGVVVGAVGATRSPFLDVDHVVLQGGAHTTAQQAKAAARLSHHPQLIDVDPGTVARRVEALPWVLTATAVRQWPATVKIAITERVPVASTPAADGKWAEVDGTGRVLQLDDARPDTMPSLAGVDPAPQPGSRLGGPGRGAAAATALLPPDLKGITADVDVTPTGELEVHVVPHGVIRLGDSTQLPDKIQSAVTVLGSLNGGSWAVLDVRVPRAPVLTRR